MDITISWYLRWSVLRAGWYNLMPHFEKSGYKSGYEMTCKDVSPMDGADCSDQWRFNA